MGESGVGGENSTKQTIEGALLIGIALILYLGYALLPVIGGPLVLLCPLPLIVLALRHPLKVVLTGNMVATVLAGLLTGQPFAFVTFLMVFSLPATTMGLAIKAKLSARMVIMFGGITMTVGSLILLLVTLRTIDNVNSLENLESMYQQGVERQKVILTEKIRERASTEGWTDDKIKAAVEMNEKMLDQFSRFSWKILPAGLALGFFFEALLNYIIASAVLKRLGYKIPRLGKFLEFKLPWYTVWLLILTIVFTAVGHKFSSELFDTIGLNLQLLSSLLFSVHGLAVVLFFVEHFRKNWDIGRLPAYLILASIAFMLNAFAFIFVAFLGIYDLYFDFRNRIKTSPASTGVGGNS